MMDHAFILSALVRFASQASGFSICNRYIQKKFSFRKSIDLKKTEYKQRTPLFRFRGCPHRKSDIYACDNQGNWEILEDWRVSEWKEVLFLLSLQDLYFSWKKEGEGVTISFIFFFYTGQPWLILQELYNIFWGKWCARKRLFQNSFILVLAV